MDPTNLSLLSFSAMSIAESSKEPGYGEETCTPPSAASPYNLGSSATNLSHSNSAGSFHRQTNSGFPQQRTQL